MTKLRYKMLVCQDCGYEQRLSVVVSTYIPPRSTGDEPEDKEKEEEGKSIRDRNVPSDECPKCKSKALTTRPFAQEDYAELRERMGALLGDMFDEDSGPTGVNVQSWEEGFAALEQYYALHGDCAVPSKYVSQSGLKLGVWVTMQRMAVTTLSKERLDRLNSIGFIWQAK